MKVFKLTALAFVTSIVVVNSQELSNPLPQCQSASNSTAFNGTSGSEQQIPSTTVRKLFAKDANQGVAVSASHFYAIDNYAITKHNKTTGEPLLQWHGSDDGPIIHLDGGAIIDDLLYAPHSNYPESPITSSIEVWNASTLEHVRTHSLGIQYGSLTWIDRHPDTGVWYGAFGNYDRVQAGQMLPYGLTMRTQVVRFGDYWDVQQAWIFPEAILREMSPMSNSGGSFGVDGWLYLTGHDEPKAYVVKIPSAGSELIWVASVKLPDIAGQGIAWDRSQGRSGSLYGISRDEAQVVEMNIELQDCAWDVPSSVGQIYGPGEFVISSR